MAMESKCPNHDLCDGCRRRKYMQAEFGMDTQKPYICPVNGMCCPYCKCRHVPVGIRFYRFVLMDQLDRMIRSLRKIDVLMNMKPRIPSIRRAAVPIGTLLLTMTIPAVLSEGVNVEWKLKNKPVIFGKELQLQCEINDKETGCQNSRRKWFGGQNYDLLCQDGKCRNNNKCKETVDEMCMYTLVVYNVTEDDINCPYTCSYGIYHQRKILSLNKDSFIYDPSIKEELVKKNISVKNGDLNIFIKIAKVFPAPECVVLFENENISTAKDMTTTKRSDDFYTTEIKLTSVMSTCKGVLELSCHIGKENKTILSDFIDNCEEEKKTDDTTVLMTLIYILCGAIVLALVYVVVKGRNLLLKNKKPSNAGVQLEHLEENRKMIQMLNNLHV